MFTRFLQTLLRPLNPAFTALLGLFTACWGLWVAAPWWHVFGTSTAFSHTYLSESRWGLLAVIVGSVMMYGALRPSYMSLIYGSSVTATYWLWFGIVVLIGDWRNPSWIVYGTASSYASLIYLNVKVNHDKGHDWTGREDVG